MQVEIPPIIWHGEQNKIMSIDFYPNSDKYFVTSSYVTAEKDQSDSGLRFWELKTKMSKGSFGKE